jgi:hypothetical protein
MKGKDVMRKWLGEDGIEAVELDERADGGEVQDALLEITVGGVAGWGGWLVWLEPVAALLWIAGHRNSLPIQQYQMHQHPGLRAPCLPACLSACLPACARPGSGATPACASIILLPIRREAAPCRASLWMESSLAVLTT